MDSPTPVIFKRTKAKHTARARDASPEHEAEKAADTTEDSPSTLALKLKNKIKRTKAKSRLSFGGDEDEEGDGEVFKVKKSNLSRKMALGIHPATVPSSLEQATISNNDGPKYDAASLKELKANTPTARPPQPSDIDPTDVEMSMDVDDIVQTIDIDNVENTPFIPAESSIQVAKQKRERLRKNQATGEDDFISLSVMKRDDEPQGPHPESRLVREEDEFGEGDDEFAEYTSAQERIALGKKSKKLEATKRRDAMKEMIADAEEEDEETVEWEQEQLRRGGHRTPDPSSSKVQEVYKPAPIPLVTPIPSLAPALSNLSDRLAELTTSHAKNSAALSALAKERQEVEDRETEMREMVEKAEEKRAWFTDFKEWTESVASFLDEKYPLLESLEEEYMSLLKERFDMIAKRRREDFEDDLASFLGPLPDPPSIEPEETDEHGRTIPKPPSAEERRRRRVERTTRRQIRRSRLGKRQDDEEGYSTDSSMSPQDVSAYGEALESISSRTKEILADVKALEFKDPGKGRWSIWRERYPDSYIGAWGGLGVVSVWEFWVRLESLGWNWIEDKRTLDSFKWYKGLFEYCRPGEGIVEERELGPDGDLVASMISSAIIPLVAKTIDNGGLDVYSLDHTKRIVDLAEEIEASVEPGGGKYQLLVKSIINSFENAVSAIKTSIDAYSGAHISLPGFNPDSIPSRQRFLNRCIKLLKNLLRWRKYGGDRFGLDRLIGLLVEDCIVIVARTGWEVGGEDAVRTVLQLLPDGLVPSSLARLRGPR